jgi:hypothetical protein
MTMKIRIDFLCAGMFLTVFGGAFGQPTITRQPMDQSVSLGAIVTNQIIASGIAPLHYQWRLNEMELLSATNRGLVLNNVQLTTAGDYSVVVTNGSGSVTSRVAHLEVDSTFTKITTGSIVNDGGDSGACAWGDYDSDGYPDLFVTNLERHKNFLYHNNRDGTFTRITAGMIANDIQNWRGCAWADYDNDGNLDLIVTGVDDNDIQAFLYRNSGNGTFTRTTLGGIAPFGSASEGPSWADYDNDGLVDLFVARYGSDWLFHNDGNGVFRSMINNLAGAGTDDSYTAAWADYNKDGRPDLFVAVSSDPPRNRLYLNIGGGAFAKITSGSIVSDSAHSYTGTWADYDNDGYPDLFVANGGDLENNALYHNKGDGTFTKMTSDVVGSLVSDGSSNAGVWGDYDNDGYLDLFVSNFTRAILNNFQGAKNFLYHNNGNGSFSRILTGSLVNDVAVPGSCAWGDYDNDGFLDLFVANGGHTPQNNALYRNNGNSNGWIKVKLTGTVSNRSAIGAKVRAKATIGGKTFWQLREINTGPGWNGSPLEAHIGLGDATIVQTLRIEWPSGTVQEFHDLTTKQLLPVTEPSRLTAQMANSDVQLVLNGGRGFKYGIEASTDLKIWSQITSLTITNLNGTVAIEAAATQGQTFYRAVWR